MKNISELHSYIPGRDIVARAATMHAMDSKDIAEISKNYEALAAMGIQFDRQSLAEAARFASDSIQQAPITSPTIPSLVQWLQNWTPGMVRVLTAARKADEAIGIATIGSWEDEQVVVSMIEDQASAVAYGDYAQIPLASFNPQYNPFTVVRLTMGLKITNLEADRASRARINAVEEKRRSCAEALEIARNTIAFFGYNPSNLQNYGILNFPALPAYYTVAVGASASTLWSRKTFLEITADIRTAVSNLLTQSQERANCLDVPCTLLLPTNSVTYLSTVSDFGISVMDWMKDAYPKIRVVSAPQFNLANGGANVMYLYADEIVDGSTDGGSVWLQAVPAKSLMLGVERQVQGYLEGYVNATAGSICKRPFAVVRASGI